MELSISILSMMSSWEDTSVLPVILENLMITDNIVVYYISEVEIIVVMEFGLVWFVANDPTVSLVSQLSN